MNHRALRRYYLYTFLGGLQFGWTTWLAFVLSRGGNPGWAESAFHLAIWLGEVPTGAVADILGRRVSMMVGLFVGAIASFGFPFIHGTNSASLVLAVSGLGGTFLSGADTALLYETAVEAGGSELARKALARASALQMVALSIAPVVAGLLYQWHELGPFISRGVLSLVGVVVVWGMRESREPRAEGEPRPSIWTQTATAVRIIAANPRLLFIMFFTACYNTVGAIAGQYGQSYFPYVGFSMAATGVLFAAARILTAGTSSLSERLTSNGARRFLRFAPLAQALGYIGMGFGGVRFGPLCYVLGDALDGGISPQLSHQLNEAIPSQQRSTILSLQSAAISMMMVVAFPAASYLKPVTNIYTVTGLAGALLAIVWLVRRRSY